MTTKAPNAPLGLTVWPPASPWAMALLHLAHALCCNFFFLQSSKVWEEKLSTLMFKEPLKSSAERQTCSRDGGICICSPSRFQTLSVLHSFWCFKVAASEGAQTAVGWSKYSIIQKVSSLPLSPSLCVCTSCSLTACGVCGCWWNSSCHHWNICLHWDRVALSFYIKSTPHTNTSTHTHTITHIYSIMWNS